MKTNSAKEIQVDSTTHRTSTLQSRYKCETGKGSIRTIRSKKKQATRALSPLRMAVGSAKFEEFIRYHAARYVGTVSDWFTDRPLTTD